MSAFLPGDPLLAASDTSPAATSTMFRRVLKNPTGLISTVFLAALVVVAVLAPLIAPMDPDRAAATDILAGPGRGHLLGADGSGHDILSRLIFATRLSLAGALVVLVVSAVIGTATGLLAGYYGRRLETVLSWIASGLMSLPGIVVLLATRAALGPSIFAAMAVLGVLISPAFYRVVYGAVSAVRGELYVDAARVFGLSDARIISRHVLRVVLAPIIILAAGVAGIAIAIQAGLDFLGLGDLSKPTWGGMLNDAFINIFSHPIQLLWPALAIGLTSIALALLGNALRDELERTTSQPRKRRRAPGRPVDSSGTVSGPPPIEHETAADPAVGPALLAVRGLAVGYDQPDGSTATVVHDVSLTVRRGEVHGLIGESGSGKTQTAFAVMRLLAPGGRILAGTVELDGLDLATATTTEMTRLRGRRLAYIPQEPMANLDPSFTVGSQLTEPMRVVLGLNRKEARERALALLERVGIADPRRTYGAYPHQISGGMAQRVLIAGAVSCEPDLLIADEPTTALDVTVQAEVLDLLRDLQSDFGMGVLLVTHNFGVVADICDSVSVMQGGRIVETGPVRSIFGAPQHPYTQSLFDAIVEDSAPRKPLGVREASSISTSEKQTEGIS